MQWLKPPRVFASAKDLKSLGTRGLQGITATNSNTKISVSRLTSGHETNSLARKTQENLGLNSERLRAAMVERLHAQGITDERVLSAMQRIPRHAFVDEALASRAYDDAALPIGHGQTISQPWVVARMISAVCEIELPTKVLEVGTGCGYQAAVMSYVFPQVYSIERIRSLYDMAKDHLRELRLTKVRLSYGDGMAGLASAAPFDAIVVAAAGLKIPQALMQQLRVGGILIAPEGAGAQKLIRIQRTSETSWSRQELEEVRFVPLKSGLQP
ncbi:protein-L-isoaspartate(D-aspartate) O-methyltransferase [Zwartia panacis]|jgi:protein-L-isoaspartate(D-aspartate) O-methyltransferase|uniref:protein-L-isoaspartate(D-aspartate) O-methyltransferase n=1 Tax=Zwartia panacis TaxID=2683345 RepID=UPI0025B5BA04|nr:protein-L-isoaspartate(D-aspartate) O-methyltransferase [Zwartia panacis]MDN4016878.1 protein-L-isoaspartate(D-aspartate) O-methyltransferase [Zwartia panacis]